MNFERQQLEKQKYVNQKNLLEYSFFFQNKKKEFDKTTQRYCTLIENNMKIPTKRSDLFQEVKYELNIYFNYEKFQADANLQMQTKKFREETLDYVFLLQQVQERKKFDFVETVINYKIFSINKLSFLLFLQLLALMLNFLSFYHAGKEKQKIRLKKMVFLQVKKFIKNSIIL